jgi:hypothetical protein
MDVPESSSSDSRFQQSLQIRFWIWQIFAGFLPDLIAVLACFTHEFSRPFLTTALVAAKQKPICSSSGYGASLSRRTTHQRCI